MGGALAGGYLADRVGRKRLCIASGLLAALGAVLLLSARGQVETAWEGYIPELEFRQRFLKGQRQER